MVTSMRKAIAGLIALITFVFVGAPMVWDLQTWECNCSRPICGECGQSESEEWAEFNAIAFAEYADEFTSLFEGYETKWSKNNRLMLKRPGQSFKFVAKGK